MSVNRTVARTRSNSTSSSRIRRANRSTFSTTASAASQHSEVIVDRELHERRRRGSVRPMYRAFSIGSTGLPIACITRVGTWIVGRIARTSLSRTRPLERHHRSQGFAADRKYRAHRSIVAASSEMVGRQPAEVFLRIREAFPTRRRAWPGTRPTRPRFRRHGKSGADKPASRAVHQDQAGRALREGGCEERAEHAPVLVAEQQRALGAGGVHHRPDVVHAGFERCELPRSRSEFPLPRRSKAITRENEASRRK